MLSLANNGRYPAPDLPPHQRRQKTLKALIAQIEAVARREPVLIIFEDAHWADPSSLAAFEWLVDKIDSPGVVLFVTFRPEPGYSNRQRWMARSTAAKGQTTSLIAVEVLQDLDSQTCIPAHPAHQNLDRRVPVLYLR
jgi:predicted ATPase